jgi:hypothetical protein
MDQVQGSSENAPKGYLSQKHKEKFTIIAGVLGALFFFAQLIDFAVIGWPAIVGVLFFVSPLSDMEEIFLSDVFPGLTILAFMLFGFLWLIICLFGYSFLEK